MLKDFTLIVYNKANMFDNLKLYTKSSLWVLGYLCFQAHASMYYPILNSGFQPARIFFWKVGSKVDVEHHNRWKLVKEVSPY